MNDQAALLEIRRYLHAHPELSGHEQRTAALVAGELRQLGWQVREGVGRTGWWRLGPRRPRDWPARGSRCLADRRAHRLPLPQEPA